MFELSLIRVYFKTFESYTILPPIVVKTLCVFGISDTGAVNMSCERTVKSANFPFAKMPFSFSENSANAEPAV